MIVIGFVVAAGVGAVGRWWIGLELGRPAGTLLANLVGSFILGLLVGQGDATHTIVGVAGLGALTTWSTFIAELADLAEDDMDRALRYGVTALIAGVAAAWLGLQLG